MSVEKNKATNRQFYEQVINQQKLDSVEEFVGANYTSHSFPPELPPGPAGLKAFLGAFFAGFPDGKVAVEGMFGEGNMVATRLTFTGTHTGEFQGIPATGKSIAIPAIDLSRFEEGKIVDHWGGPDQFSLLMQLGVLSPPG